MKTLAWISVVSAVTCLFLGCSDQAPSQNSDGVLFNPGSPATVPQLFVPANNSGSPQLIAWRDYRLGTNAYRAKFTYREDAYMVDQFTEKSPRQYMASVEVFSLARVADAPVLTAIGHEFNGFYVKNSNGFWAAFDSIHKPEDALKAMLKRAQEPWPDEATTGKENQ